MNNDESASRAATPRIRSVRTDNYHAWVALLFEWGALRRLTFDMRGGRQLAKPDVARPLDGRVRARLRSAHAFRRMPTGDDAPCCWRHEDEALERTFDCTALHAVADCELAESKHCALGFASGGARRKRRGLPCSSSPPQRRALCVEAQRCSRRASGFDCRQTRRGLDLCTLHLPSACSANEYKLIAKSQEL